jgi:two-component system probable response regulator PhcQ
MPSILLLDDEPHVVAALRRALRTPLGEGVTMECFTDPHEALARVGEHSFDVVVSDFRMPQMDGTQFLRFVRAIQPEAVRMVVSASTEISGVMSAINELGVFRYVVKPWTTELLIEDVQSALQQAAEAREQRRLADEARVQKGELGAAEAERRRLEEMEPGITNVQWGPNGEVLMPTLPAPLQ